METLKTTTQDVDIMSKLLEMIQNRERYVSEFTFVATNSKKTSKGEVYQEIVKTIITGTLRSYSESTVEIKLENGEIKTFSTSDLKFRK